MINESPLFIFGCYRSGTSLLRVMLNAHQQIFLPEETVFIPIIGRSLARQDALDVVQNRDALLREIIGFLREKALWKKVPSIEDVQRLLPVRPSYQDVIKAVILSVADKDIDGLRYWGDKTPIYVNSVFYLNHLFPQAKFINVVRDGRDVAASVKKEFAWGGRTPIMVAEEWNQRILNGLLGEREIGQNRFITVHYEELVSSPSEVLHRLTDFLGLDFDKSMLAYHATSSAKELSRYGRHKNVARPISTQSIGRYRDSLTAEEIQAFEQEAGNTLAAMGYPINHLAITATTPIEKVKDNLSRIFNAIAHRVFIRIAIKSR